MNKTLFCCFGCEIGSSWKFFFYENAKFQHSKLISLQVLAHDYSKFQLSPQKDCWSVSSVNFISMRAPKQLLFLSIFWRIKKQKSNPLILSLRNISDLCFSPFFYIISSFILDFILLISFNKLFTGLKTWEYNSSTSLARGGLQVGLQCCCCVSVQCLKVFINLPSLRTPLSHTGRKGKW